MNNRTNPALLDGDQQDSAQVAALASSQVHPESALPSRRYYSPQDVVGRAALNEFIDKYCLSKSELVACAESAFYWFNKCASWTPASRPPDADITVMLALADGEVWQGYFDGEGWIEVSGLRLQAGRVTYWQHTPKHPEDKS